VIGFTKPDKFTKPFSRLKESVHWSGRISVNNKFHSVTQSYHMALLNFSAQV